LSYIKCKLPHTFTYTIFVQSLILIDSNDKFEQFLNETLQFGEISLITLIIDKHRFILIGSYWQVKEDFDVLLHALLGLHIYKLWNFKVMIVGVLKSDTRISKPLMFDCVHLVPSIFRWLYFFGPNVKCCILASGDNGCTYFTMDGNFELIFGTRGGQLDI